MSLFVNTNVTSLNGSANLNKATKALDTTYSRLSSGLRINSAKDDAAGLQISDRLTSQINGLNQGNRNANDGIALAQTAEGAMDEITTMLQRIRTLANQSANGTNTKEDRISLQKEVSALCAEITRIACKTTYGGGDETILNASDKSYLMQSGKCSFQVGANANTTISIDLSAGFTMSQMQTKVEADINADTSLSSDEKQALLSNLSSACRTYGTTDAANYTASSTDVTFSVSTQVGAQATLAMIDRFISYVDGKRADLGAVQNRLESTIRNQTNIATNESDARSRIRDTDYAEEAANLAQQNIIQQAASSMLTQANSRPQLALSLLG